MKIGCSIFFCLLSIYGLHSQESAPDALSLLKSSIRYHDPDGVLVKHGVELHLTETRPGGSDRLTRVQMKPTAEEFSMKRTSDGTEITMRQSGKELEFLLDGSVEYSPEDEAKHRLNKERLITMKDYYQYLWYLPSKLLDRGTIIDPVIQRVNYFGTSSWQMKVTYDEKVGKDTWYFYFHPDNHALIGYRFYHDEAANDGEYILLEDEIVVKKVRIPKMRKWYTHKEGKYLGADILTEMKIKK